MMKSDPKAQFANIIEKINEGFVALDAGMNYTYINQRGSELLRRKPEELIGKNYWEEYPRIKIHPSLRLTCGHRSGGRGAPQPEWPARHPRQG